MTENELAMLIKYHENMRDHEKRMIAHYKQRQKKLRQQIAEKTSKQKTEAILEKLQNEQASR